MFCAHCGAEIHDDAAICIKCGRATERSAPVARSSNETNEAMQIVIKVFMILGCVSCGWLLFPLAWCIPMTVSVFHSFRDKTPVSTGMKVCTLLFVNLIAGICLLCMEDK